eukprot:TRINITY_DN2791_c0_g1_i1.p1 TRINITY_DN2791_c0_g1~~TRINITY_DN2791_c0_g1_i1.p1  ORF type:complete len:116 (+),score=7.28 TRINITY_DN2791_c0_g1_i1:162-509(+)
MTSRAMVISASSVFVPSFAEVSKNRAPCCSANCAPRALDTTLSFSGMSHLLAMTMIVVCSVAFFSHSRITWPAASNEGSLVGSYTTNTPPACAKVPELLSQFCIFHVQQCPITES